MAKINRFDGNLKAFGADAPGQERVVFGNQDSPPVQSDDLTANITSDFLRGWGTLALGNKPPREWFNSVAFVATQLAAYLHQIGIAEYDNEQEYQTGSLALFQGIVVQSQVDDNVGNDPLTSTSWTVPTSIANDVLKDLNLSLLKNGARYSFNRKFSGAERLQAVYEYVSDRDKTEHDGVTIIDPDRIGAWDGTPADLSTFYTAAVSGVGCLVLVSPVTLRGELLGLSNVGAGNDAAFNAANSIYEDTGEIFTVKGGSYPVTGDINVQGLRLRFTGDFTTTGGRLVGLLYETVDRQSGAVSYSVGEPSQFGSYYRFGRTRGGPIGLVIGGGEASEGVDGNVIHADGYGGWSVIQPTKYTSSSEFAIQPSDAVGVIETQSGTGNIVRQSGQTFLDEWVGRRLYLPGQTYRISNVVDGDNITLVNLDNSPVSFPSTDIVRFQVVGILTEGQGELVGGTFTRTTGDPFIPGSGFEYNILLNGTLYAVGSIIDSDTVTVISPPADGTYLYKSTTTIDDLTAALRVHKTTGFGVEQNVTLGAYASGKFHLYAATSDSQDFPFFIGNEFESGGDERRQISLFSDGFTAIGGDLGASLQVPYSEAENTTKVEIVGTQSGVNEAIVRAVSTAADADLYLRGKGNGYTGFGTHTASADVPVTGYIEIKDTTGVVRRLAVVG